MMTLFSDDRTALLEVSALERDGHELIIRGKVFGTMPITARLTPEQARNGLRMLGFKLLVFLITMLVRRQPGR